MTKLSIQHQLRTVRAPRVKITYDVETGGATEKKELPFVMGVIGDFSGDPTGDIGKMKDRKFIEVNRDNFNDVLARMKPGLKMRVENTLEGDGSEIAVDLKFNNMKDFEPAQIVEQVDPLKKLMDARQKLTELKAKVDLEDKLEDNLKELLQDPNKIAEAGGQISGGDDSSE